MCARASVNCPPKNLDERMKSALRAVCVRVMVGVVGSHCGTIGDFVPRGSGSVELAVSGYCVATLYKISESLLCDPRVVIFCGTLSL